MLILQGTIVNRTYGIHKPFIFHHFLYQYLVVLNMAPRNRRPQCTTGELNPWSSLCVGHTGNRTSFQLVGVHLRATNIIVLLLVVLVIDTANTSMT